MSGNNVGKPRDGLEKKIAVSMKIEPRHLEMIRRDWDSFTRFVNSSIEMMYGDEDEQ